MSSNDLAPRMAGAASPLVPLRLEVTAEAWAQTEPWIAYGKLVLGVLGLAGLLFSFVTISGAVVTQGTVSVENATKTVQHLDGGIVKKIFVKDGNHVNAGDLIVKLDDTQIFANLAIARGRALDAAIQNARLEAERDGKSTFVLSPSTPVQSDPVATRMLEAQQALFNARLAGRHGEDSVLRERVKQLAQDYDGLDQQLKSRQRELDYVNRELAGVLPLYEKGYVAQSRVGPLQRDQARLQGEVGQLGTQVEKAKAASDEAKLKLEQNAKDFNSQVAEEIRKAVTQYEEARQTLAALEDKLAGTEIRAPRAGVINALAVTTEGGVIAPGAAIAQVVPDDEKLVIEAKISPNDIDKVRGGLEATVKFPAFDARSTPRLEGQVTIVSPAALADKEQQNKPYFLAQIELLPSEVEKLGGDHRLIPGMPAEVYIETRQHSLLGYIVKPIADIVGRLGRDG
jgi:membrane fusion protein, type I secretion system